MLDSAILNVLTREHVSDVERLNKLLNLSGDSLLDPNVPPHTFVGDIDNLIPGDCVLLLGINPKRNFDQNFQRVNIDLPKRCLSDYRKSGNPAAFTKQMAFQKEYFLREERNRRYFNKYGDWLGKYWFTDTRNKFANQDPKQMVCHQHLVEVDTIQYYSHKTGLNPDILADAIQTDPALQANMKMIEELVKKVKPKWIQITGKSGWTIIERLFGECEFVDFNPGEKRGTEIRMGHVKIGETVTPVLMTKFFGSMSGVNSNVQKEQVATAWQDWLNTI